MLMSADASQLVLVDLQQRLMPAIAGADAVVANALRLAGLARALGVPVWGTEQSPDKLGPNLPAVRAACERTLAKTAFDATADGLLELLEPGVAAGRGEIAVAGCEAHICLLQTVLGVLAAGRRVRVVMDACGSRSPHSHAAAMARLTRAGAEIVTTEMVGFEWLRRADHAAFRSWQAAIP